MKSTIGLALAALLPIAAASPGTPSPETSPVVTLPQGKFAGESRDQVTAFLGLPYAATPIGSQRWAPPGPPLIERGIRQAQQFGPSCPQELRDTPMMAWTMEFLPPRAPGINEDCLSLNVWKPATSVAPGAKTALPVLVFLHGGGFTSGSTSVPIYDGAKLAGRGMIVVTANYRLGTLGFLAHKALTAEQGRSGNYALQDQIAALRWVRSNIAAFGGDPAKVTLAGQSAGAWSVMALMASPEAKGLFRSAIALSTPNLGDYRSQAEGERHGDELFAKWKVNSLKAARVLPAAKLTGATAYGNMVADGAVIPIGATSRTVGSDVPVMMGYMLNDLFAPSPKVDPVSWAADVKKRYGANALALLRFYPGRTTAEARRSAAREAGDRLEFGPLPQWVAERPARSPVYVYRFSHVEPGPDSAKYGAFHTAELPYMFDTLDKSPGRPFTTVDRHVVAQFSGAIENFVKHSDPNGPQLPAWVPLTQSGKILMEFGDHASPSRVYPLGSDDLVSQGQPPATGVTR